MYVCRAGKVVLINATRTLYSQVTVETMHVMSSRVQNNVFILTVIVLYVCMYVCLW